MKKEEKITQTQQLLEFYDGKGNVDNAEVYSAFGIDGRGNASKRKKLRAIQNNCKKYGLFNVAFATWRLDRNLEKGCEK